MRIILFPLSIGFGLICRTWAFLITHNRPLGRADWAFILHPGLASQRLECLYGNAQRIGPLSWAGVKRPKCFNEHASPLGLKEWACEPIFQTLSKINIHFHSFFSLQSAQGDHSIELSLISLIFLFSNFHTLFSFVVFMLANTAFPTTLLMLSTFFMFKLMYKFEVKLNYKLCTVVLHARCVKQKERLKLARVWNSSQ